MYSHDEFKDITDIVKVLFKVGYCYTTCTLMFTCLPIFLNLLVAWTGLSNLLDPKGNAVCSFTLILTNFWDTIFRVELGMFLSAKLFSQPFSVGWHELPSGKIGKLLDLDFCRLASLTSVVRFYTILFSFFYSQALINVMTMCSSKKLVSILVELFSSITHSHATCAY